MSPFRHKPSTFLFTATFAFFCLILAGTTVFAQPPATLDINQAKKDADFPFLGEFVGPVETKPGRYERIALQIRPIGNKSFEAIQYMGGLPGEKSHVAKPTKLIALRHDDFLVLSGGPYALVVHPDRCIVIDKDGNRKGWLERIVRKSPTLGAPAPKDAVVMFDGTSTKLFKDAKMTKDGLLMEGTEFKLMFQDFNLHLEFMLPYKPLGRGQDRGNSGVYLQSRYEVQVLDSFAKIPEFNDCGSLYRTRKPDLNMALVPLQWQTYDIMFTAPRWASDPSKVHNARITVWLNGVKIHDNVELPSKTGAGKIEEPTLLPIKLQDHNNPVRYRNIWLIDRGVAQVGKFPVMGPKEKPEPAKKPETPKTKPEAQKPEEKAAPAKEAPKEAPKKEEPKPKTEESAPVEKPAVKEETPKASDPKPVAA